MMFKYFYPTFRFLCGLLNFIIVFTNFGKNQIHSGTKILPPFVFHNSLTIVDLLNVLEFLLHSSGKHLPRDY